MGSRLILLKDLAKLLRAIQAELIQTKIIPYTLTQIIDPIVKSIPSDLPTEKLVDFVYYRVIFYLSNRADTIESEEVMEIYNFVDKQYMSEAMKKALFQVRKKILH